MSHISNVRPEPDRVLVDIVDYVLNYKIDSAMRSTPRAIA